MQRIVIIGNSGSGKTYLANQIGEFLSLPVIHLDQLFWEPGGFNLKRPKETVFQEVSLLKMENDWIVEGVFGELAQEFIERANCFIWLDMDWEDCRKNLLERGSESSRQLDPEQAEIKFQELLEWASHYWDRTNPRSHAWHNQLYASFSGTKYRLKSREDIHHFLAQGLDTLFSPQDGDWIEK